MPPKQPSPKSFLDYFLMNCIEHAVYIGTLIAYGPIPSWACWLHVACIVLAIAF